MMLSKTLFPGVAVVTGAGGTGLFCMECVADVWLTPCRHRGCRSTRLSGGWMRQDRHHRLE